MLGTPVDVFLNLSPVEPVVEEPDPDPEPTKIFLDDHGTEALMEAIVRQAKTDWLTAYHDEVTGFKPKDRRQQRLTTNQIERELKHFWFRHILIGNLTDDKHAVEKMIRIWRKEAKGIYDSQRSS